MPVFKAPCAFSTEFYTRGMPRLLASSEQAFDQCHSSRVATFLPVHTVNRVQTLKADGCNMLDVWKATAAAVAESRKTNGPVMLVLGGLPRRFGHAATDRQAAYLSDTEITDAVRNSPLAGACAQAVDAGAFTYPELVDMLEATKASARKAFDAAVLEPKISSRQQLMDTNSQPLAPVPISATNPTAGGDVIDAASDTAATPAKKPKLGDVMRKNMTKFFGAFLEENKDAVYVGEDVEHGGYYLVTEKLAKKYPGRVRDFPPDETSLLALGMGFARCAFFGRNLHSRMPLDPTHVRLKRTRV
jgi:hypothetical protein